MSNKFERLSKMAQDEFGVTIKPKHPTGETFESLYGETTDIDRKEKQLEEIAKVMCGGCPDNKECMHCLCADWYNAEALYNAGYCKQREVSREIFEMIITTIFSKMPSDILLVGKDCDFADGIRMGKREAIFDMINTLAELKKKYTEESRNDR